MQFDSLSDGHASAVALPKSVRRNSRTFYAQSALSPFGINYSDDLNQRDHLNPIGGT